MNQPYPSRIFDNAGADHRPAEGRHFDYLGIRVPNGWTSAAFTFGLSGSVLLSSAADVKYGIYSFLGLTGLLIAMFPHFALKANVRNALLWTYPFWALFSIGWSIDADRTFHGMLLVIPTIVAALTIGAMPDRRAANAGAALAFIAYIGASLVMGGTIYFADSGGGGAALSGLTTGKNYFGHLSAMSLIISASLLAFAGEERGRPLAMIGLAGLAGSAFAVLRSHATGSIIAAMLSMGIVVAAMMFRRVIWQFRIVLLAAIVGGLIVYVTFGKEIQDDLFAYVLKTFNKDTTLTGRTFLWDYADRLIGEKPMLGYGFNAFWYISNPEAWTLWRTMGVQPMSGFNFHNTPREILIDGGWIGLALFAASTGFAFVMTMLRTLARGDLISAVRLGFLFYFILRMAVESTGFAAVTVDTLLVFGFLCSPVLPKDQPAKRARPLPSMRGGGEGRAIAWRHSPET